MYACSRTICAQVFCVYKWTVCLCMCVLMHRENRLVFLCEFFFFHFVCTQWQNDMMTVGQCGSFLYIEHVYQPQIRKTHAHKCIINFSFSSHHKDIYFYTLLLNEMTNNNNNSNTDVVSICLFVYAFRRYPPYDAYGTQCEWKYKRIQTSVLRTHTHTQAYTPFPGFNVCYCTLLLTNYRENVRHNVVHTSFTCVYMYTLSHANEHI